MAEMRYIDGVVTLKYDESLCNGCRMCEAVCPRGVFEVDGKAKVRDLDACMECGACAKNCPQNAISLSPGVGCASAIIWGWVTRSEPSCGC